jgi:hypothetical protein
MLATNGPEQKTAADELREILAPSPKPDGHLKAEQANREARDLRAAAAKRYRAACHAQFAKGKTSPSDEMIAAKAELDKAEAEIRRTMAALDTHRAAFAKRAHHQLDRDRIKEIVSQALAPMEVLSVLRDCAAADAANGLPPSIISFPEISRAMYLAADIAKILRPIVNGTAVADPSTAYTAKSGVMVGPRRRGTPAP